ncbi:hypothetical protein L6452_02542 [Arctium lappa]|uniref:Uncharacterized protein n=1 Tax=Arctium lappa TaxID=4217 RepID=A0ACB9FJV4_ARCLA|nr:hypothetical protein L6452_02542 [Arctium lappa]
MNAQLLLQDVCISIHYASFDYVIMSFLACILSSAYPYLDTNMNPIFLLSVCFYRVNIMNPTNASIEDITTLTTKLNVSNDEDAVDLTEATEVALA